MLKELKIFLTAVMFLTRIPCPQWVDFSDADLSHSAKYFSLIGILVGTIGGLVYYLSAQIFPQTLALLFSIITTILITGAFHEDGFADVCDAFGGGYSKENILLIMKDSRLGTFGTLGLIIILAVKYLTLLELNPVIIVYAMIAGHSISRFAAVTVLFTHIYARKNDELSKSKPVATKLSLTSLLIAAFFGIIPILLLGYQYLLLIIPVFIVRELTITYFNHRINGYTGDCLGAIQQLCEVTFYLFAILQPWKYF